MKKPENEKKNYQIAVDEGFARKIVFINKHAFITRSLSEIIPLAEEAGDEEKFRGFHATAPTIYCWMDKFHQQKWDSYYSHQGSLYMRQNSHKEIVVFCHIRKMTEYEVGSSVGKFIKDVMTEFGQNKKQ